MKRRDFVKLSALAGFSGMTLKLKGLHQLAERLTPTDVMPILFIGHGSPMNAIEDNEFTRGMREATRLIPTPQAVLMISAHWETNGVFVTAQDAPKTIHDFYGFPQELYQQQYPAPGSRWLAEETAASASSEEIHLTHDWGFDHGCWSVAMHMFPEANIPIVQMSLDTLKDASWHYQLAGELQALRKKGVLIIGSGNMVHNLRLMRMPTGDFNTPYAFDWAKEASEFITHHIESGTHNPLLDYRSQGPSIQLAIPTPEHFLPLVYILGMQQKKDDIFLFNDQPLAGSITMTSILLHQG